MQNATTRVREEPAADVTIFERRILPREATPPPPVPPSAQPVRADHRKRVSVIAGALLTLGAVAPIVAFTNIFGGGPAPAPAAAHRPEPAGTKGAAPDTHESLFGHSGYSDLTSGTGRSAAVVDRREKAGRAPRESSRKGRADEVAIRPAPAPSATPGRGGAEPPAVSRESSTAEPAVTVVTRVENGRVVEAYVANRRPGMEAHEASALRAARQRRFSPGTNGSEQVQIKVGKQ